MESEKAAEPQKRAQHPEPCVCRELAHHLASAFGVQSEEARGHLRNARIEVLKAMRSLIDDRIQYLSRTQSKGTSVPVE